MFHEIHCQAYFNVMSDYWQLWKYQRYNFCISGNKRNEVLIVQGYKGTYINILFRYCPISKVQISGSAEKCVQAFLIFDWLIHLPMHKWALYIGWQLLYTPSDETFKLYNIVFPLIQSIFCLAIWSGQISCSLDLLCSCKLWVISVTYVHIFFCNPG